MTPTRITPRRRIQRSQWGLSKVLSEPLYDLAINSDHQERAVSHDDIDNNPTNNTSLEEIIASDHLDDWFQGVSVVVGEE